MDKKKIMTMVAALAAILVIVRSLTKLAGGDSMSLSEYAALNASARPSEGPLPGEEPDAPSAPPVPSPTASPAQVSALIGASLNGSSQLKERTTYTEGFYYEPLSDNLRRYITGISYPAGQPDTKEPAVHPEQNSTAAPDSLSAQNGTAAPDSLPAQNNTAAPDSLPAQNGTAAPDAPADRDGSTPEAQGSTDLAELEQLRYVHIWHYDFSGTPQEGELICNEYIARDLVEIFYELYRNEYQLGKVLLIDEYDGDADAAREDNNSFCFYFPQDTEDSGLSKHAAGLALDINPLYNPRIAYEANGSRIITPASAADYADRTAGFPYKIDEDDLCCKLFVRHGFTWGGNRNNGKDYQHFQKVIP